MRFFGRKADITISTIVKLVLALLVLLAISYIFWKFVIDTKGTLEECPGECLAVCGGDRPITHKIKCYKNGELVPNTKCCVNPRDLTPTDPVPAPAPDDLGKPSIEVRLGLLDTPISHGSIQVLDVGRSYTFWVWGFGTNMSTCTVRIVDAETGDVIPSGHPLAKSVSRQACVDNTKPRNVFDRDNKIQIVLEPIEGVVYSRYVMQVYLFDVNGVQNQSAIINLRVSQPTGPGNLDILPDNCIYNSCEDITQLFHCTNPGTSTVNCPNLDCAWIQAEQRCVTRSAQSGSGTFQCPSSCSGVPMEQCDNINAFCPGLNCEWSSAMGVGCIERIT